MKNLQNLGKALNKAEQKEINGAKVALSSGSVYCGCTPDGGGSASSCDDCQYICGGGGTWWCFGG